MTSGVYGLECPDTGAVRYVGASRQMEIAHRNQCAKPWKWLQRGPLLDWFAQLHREEKTPRLVVLQEADEAEFSQLKVAWIVALQKTGEADLNGGK